MASGKFVVYYRVSTQRQGASGLGLEAQRETVKNYLNGGSWQVVGEYQEVETAKGSNALSKRPQLAAALALCKKTGARLLVPKLDRLSRNVAFIANLMESNVRFVACDLPEANELTLHIMAAFAAFEAKRISERTKDALAAARTRGVVLGKAGPVNLRPNVEQRQREANAFARRLHPMVEYFRSQKYSQQRMAEELNAMNIRAPRGGQWTQPQVNTLLARLARTTYAEDVAPVEPANAGIA
ncbi:recombinase family protein [Paraburkholderia kururiensis]|uniref:recombinase family protein n=1 Tax=Paraburkholderia kururiensis TaxID=984307 RepID=UPI0005AA0B3E|nr:recombinase family protein [Paraburkholderia kururiensis]